MQGSVRVWADSSLTDVSALGGISIAGGNLDFRDNPSLTTLTGLSNVSITSGSLCIGNPDWYAGQGTWLANFDGLSNLKVVNGDLIIHHNPSF